MKSCAQDYSSSGAAFLFHESETLWELTGILFKVSQHFCKTCRAYKLWSDKQSTLKVLETSESILCGFRICAPIFLCHTVNLGWLHLLNGFKLNKVRVGFFRRIGFECQALQIWQVGPELLTVLRWRMCVMRYKITLWTKMSQQTPENSGCLNSANWWCVCSVPGLIAFKD